MDTDSRYVRPSTIVFRLAGVSSDESDTSRSRRLGQLSTRSFKGGELMVYSIISLMITFMCESAKVSR